MVECEQQYLPGSNFGAWVTTIVLDGLRRLPTRRCLAVE
jgi:hypothetical protein